MQAIHSFEFGFKESLEEEGGRERLADALLENPPIAPSYQRTPFYR